MARYKCPFCNTYMAINYQTKTEYKSTFDITNYIETIGSAGFNSKPKPTWMYQTDMYKCPNCERISVLIYGIEGEINGKIIGRYPLSNAIKFPEYIPEPIRNDYEEACAILSLSPKASATLSRRCLQGMIRDYFGISKSRLIDEIEAIKDKVPPDQWKVIDALRKLGNIGAHMEKDINLIIEIDEDEADKLLKLIECLMKDWYINRHEQESLYANIIGIANNKKS